jgi:hypothetical protein
VALCLCGYPQAANKKGRPQAAIRNGKLQNPLAGDFLQLLQVHVEVGVDVLHVIVLLQGLD